MAITNSKELSEPLTHQQILLRVKRILSGSSPPISQVHELHQFRVIHTVEFKDDGKDGDEWTASCHIGYNSSEIDESHLGKDVSKKAAKTLAAQMALTHINNRLQAVEELALFPVLQPVQPSEPTKNQKQLMKEYEIDHMLLSRLASINVGSTPRIGLLSIYLEQYETNTKIPLEIGLAFALLDQPSKIQAHHLVIEEHYELRNGKYVDDQKDHFLFGDSELVSEAKLGQRISQILHHFEAQCDGLVVVGHTINSDRKWLREMGITFKDGIEVLDIARAHVHATSHGKFAQVESMGKMMDQHELSYDCAHNGGNDAVYNLHVLDKMLIKARNDRNLAEKEDFGVGELNLN